MDTVELEKRMATTLPQGWKLGQIEAQQPATTYGDFKHEILNEIARCLNLPYNIAAGNSSSYNYSSGRLDGQVYFKAVGVEQSTLEAVAIDRLFGHWMAEAVRLPEMNLAGLAALGGDPPHSWFWDGFEHVDPAKEASAQETRLKNGTTTLAYEYAREGKDWEAEVRQRGKEIVLCKQLGVPVPQAGPAAKPAPAAADSNQDAANNSGEGN
jgi:capsid protein